MEYITPEEIAKDCDGNKRPSTGQDVISVDDASAESVIQGGTARGWFPADLSHAEKIQKYPLLRSEN